MSPTRQEPRALELLRPIANIHVIVGMNVEKLWPSPSLDETLNGRTVFYEHVFSA